MAHFVLVGVGGGIAAYKTATLCSQLVKRGYQVQVLMTEHATRFVQPLTFQALTHRPVVVDTFAEPDAAEIAHVAIADRADMYVIAPATANLLAKLALGIADDMVTTTALAVTAPLLVAPAMNVHMYEHPTVQRNLSLLRQRGVLVVNPGEGPLACGYTGKGRLAEPEDIADIIDAHFAGRRQLGGLRVLVSAGPTVEDIDPVRYLSNASSGKMGYALAEAALARGAEVVLVSGPTHLSPVPGARMRHVRSTEDMLRAVLDEVPAADVFISAAAPVDFRPVQRHEHKWKKAQGVPVLELEPTPDILSKVREMRRQDQVIVGFAAETRDALVYAREKLERKQLDLIVVNNVAEPDAGFGVDTNRVSLLRASGAQEHLPLLSKREVAERILDAVVERLAEVRGE
ncbi:bifunctional phosphopantothenoylcysteine decarboxylase/phosphopantothenate--cysteine ligase CoaBC [Alicyclobacillus kakegawensis]|uniref:bifunctional phosphopantothenoylcysteine decarboxylase/phosphopantothenate--cysteine ligase CoaBC n=1 Tax=Alicyclobacillus kakegawensis TaxID=392012 RepID=UPI0008362CA6|nr:bifunctional phosphopantothenoylcysteine decarboxylase/phosphopantothenate--cysteine ligase CoaBC [Alicyclobacillus kakegawensis]